MPDCSTTSELNANEKNKTENLIRDQSSFRKNFFLVDNIIYDIGLSLEEIGLYTYYIRICGKNSSCWQSNKTICQKFNISLPYYIKLKKSLSNPRKELNNLPLIHIQKRTLANGGTTTDIIDIVDLSEVIFLKQKKSKESLSQLTTFTPPLNDVYPKNTPNKNIKNISTKVDIQKKVGPTKHSSNKSAQVPPRTTSSLSKEKKSIKIQRTEFVATTEREHQRLVDKYGEEDVKKGYKYLDDWKLSYPDKAEKRKSDYMCMIKWVMDAVYERKNNSFNHSSKQAPEYKETIKEDPEENKRWAERKGAELLTSQTKYIEIGQQFVVIKNGIKTEAVPYNKRGFKEAFTAKLKELGMLADETETKNRKWAEYLKKIPPQEDKEIRIEDSRVTINNGGSFTYLSYRDSFFKKNITTILKRLKLDSYVQATS